MLDVVLDFLATEAQAYVARRTAVNGGEVGRVEPRPLVDEAGKWTIPEGQLGLALVHLEEERTLKTQQPEAILIGGRHFLRPPELRLTLHVLFAARFAHYPTALRYLSLILTFFQAHPLFTGDTFPRLDARIDKLAVELEPLTYEQLNQLWAYLGAKHLPSALYRVRVVCLQDVETVASGPPIQTISTEVLER